MISTSKTILNQKYAALNIVIYWFCASEKTKVFDRFLGVQYILHSFGLLC